MKRSDAPWVQALDSMERRLALAERFLAGETVHLDHFVLPPDLGPLPVYQEARARVLLWATTEMEQRLTAEMDKTLEQIKHGAVAGRPAEARPAPSYFDRPA